ncbi:MAG: transcriptional regulator CadC [Rhizobacter sp.]|nr:transcriptional regulator CadC [Rhizobacter sp.]
MAPMSLQEPTGAACLRFCAFEFDERRGELRRQGGAPVALRPRAEALLRLFLSQPGRLFSRAELNEALWPTTVVTDDSLVQCVGELRSALGDDRQSIIQTVRGRGYRWEAQVDLGSGDAQAQPTAVEPATLEPAELDAADLSMAKVDAVKVDAAKVDAAPAPPAAVMPRTASSAWRLVVAISVMLLGALVSRFVPGSARVHIDDEMAARNTIAVMPFSAAVDDAEAQALAGLCADAITAQFATRRGMRGVGRASTAAFAGLSIEQIAARVNARRVVVGQVARGADKRFVVDVQLISASGGDVVWSRHLETTVDNHAARSDLGQHVVNAVRTTPVVLPSDDGHDWSGVPMAVKQTVLGWREIDQRRTLADVQRARQRFTEALKDDPDSIIAANGLAVTYVVESRHPEGALTPEQVDAYEKTVEHLRDTAPEDPTALELWADLQIHKGRPDLAIPAIEKSIRLVPSYPNGYLLLATARLLTGQAAQVRALADKAIERGDGDPRRISAALLVAARAALLLGDFDGAERLANRSVAEMPSNAQAHDVLSEASVLLGKSDQARLEAAEARKLRPNPLRTTREADLESSDATYASQRATLRSALDIALRPAALAPR